ncbi:hypothetical protein [uncultured Rhodospira sp.]|uniref:hypothetical protein n=1 Tax=uncultured Rhodospira sp. TaxID=1936189 RepID=UPI002636CA4D|nr:hypothetical protein [uncultured Rhodospira sp.]
MTLPPQSYVIASDRPWNAGLVERVSARCGKTVHPITEKGALTPAHLEALAPRFVFFPHWSYKIPKAVFEAYPCVIFHMTDLPYGRGGSPLQNLIVRGHRETKITALRCVEAFDAGPVYMKRPLSLLGAAEEIFLRADRIIEDMIVEIVATEPVPVPQEGEPVVFRRRTPSDGNLAQATDLDGLYDMIRMLDAQGYPAAFVEVGPFRLDFTRAIRRCDGVVADVRITRREEASND